MAARKGHELIPGARRLIKSLRDLGYDFSQAVADVVDNAVQAKASEVDVDVFFDGDGSWVRITDNGEGLKPDELREAMRYGAERDYDDDDLGKFGLGMKTASMSQCRSLTVASRWNEERADIAAFCWDLEHIEKTNRWEILPVGRSKLDTVLRQPLKDKTGTVVLWQRLDRILGFEHPYGEKARKRLSQMCRDLELHLSMVFHRFISGQVPGKRLKIRLNTNELKPWDPFCQSEPKTKRLQPVRLHLEHEGVEGDVMLQAFVLPHQEDFSTPDAFRDAGGPGSWNQQQGFYIYRAGRMIQSGGWSNLRAPDEHTKLARIGVSFEPVLDEAFKINVAKMRVQIPSQIREDVKQTIIPLTKLAREVYDRTAKKASSPLPPPSSSVRATTPTTSLGGGGALSPTPAQTPSGPTTTARVDVMTFDEWTSRLLAIANPHERVVIDAVATRWRMRSKPRQS